MSNYYTITDTGLNELMQQVRGLVKHPNEQIESGWAEAADDAANGDNGFDSNGNPGLEIRSWNAVSGHTHIINLTQEWFGCLSVDSVDPA